MADLVEQAVWRDTIYQIETDDPVVGGPPNVATRAGVPNIPNQQLADRTAWLKGQVEAALAKLTGAELLKLILPVDGPNSALDADTLDGRQAADFILKAAQGPGNGLHADLLDGAHLAEIVQPGDVKFGLYEAPPTGWLELDGTELAKADFVDLWNASGPYLQAGSDDDHFRLIDMRGEGVRGWDHGRGVDAGRELGSWQEDMLKAHTHVVNLRRDRAGTDGQLNAVNGDESYYPGFDANLSTSTGGTETRMRNVAFMFVIKF